MALRAYRWFVRILPREFRKEYAEEMCRVAEEHWRAVKESLGPWGKVRFWTRQVAALAGAAGRLRRHGSTRRGGGMEGFLQDLRHSARSLLQHPGFALTTVVTLGLGIGATTAIFSAVHTVLLKELPYADAERVAVLFQTDLASGEHSNGVSASNIRDLAERSERLAWVSVAEPWSFDLQVEGRAESLRTWAVSEGFFEALGASAIHGRTFLPEEYVEGNDKVVVLGHRSWTSRFGADPGIVGRTIALDSEESEPYTVVGILSDAFKFPDRAEIWTPRAPRPYDDQSRGADFMTGVARLAPGASLAEAQAEVDVLALALGESYPATNASVGMSLVPIRQHLFGDVRTPLLVIMGAIASVLLIACANVAGLMLARGAQRRREYALRGALGASTGRLVRQIAGESLLLALLGCAVGVALTFVGVEVIQALGPDHLPRIDELRVDGVVLAFAAAMAGLSALLSGVFPSLSLSRPDLARALSDASRGSTGGPEGNRLRRRLVVSEVAAAVVLLVGAGLLLRSFGVLMAKPLGFDPSDRLAVQIFAYGYDDRAAFVNQVLAEIEAIPGVRRVALGSDVPGATDGTIAKIDIIVPFTIENRAPPPAGQEPQVAISWISPGYLDLLAIPIVAGRGFEPADRPDAPLVVLVNETFARRHFGDADPVGERLVVQYGRPLAREVVGVVRDVRPLGHESEPRPEVYIPMSQGATGSLTFVVETAGGAASFTAPVMEAIWKVNPSQSVWGAATLDALLADWLKERKFNVLLLSVFATLALVLAVVGIYGLISFSVERRLGELGIRRALGGRPVHIVGMVLREGALLAATGTAIGLAGAFYLSRFLQGMLYEVEPTDPLTFLALGGAVMVVATLAALLPALRAMRVDPVVALRTE